MKGLPPWETESLLGKEGSDMKSQPLKGTLISNVEDANRTNTEAVAIFQVIMKRGLNQGSGCGEKQRRWKFEQAEWQVAVKDHNGLG